MSQAKSGRRIHWQNVTTVLSAAILIAAEVFGAAFAGGWAFAITTKDTSKDKAISTWLELMLTDPDFATLRIAEAQELPVTKTIGSSDIYWIPEKYRETMMSFLPLAKTRPVVTSYPTASEYYDQAFQEVILGEKDAETALADAAKNVADFVETSGF